MKLFKYLFSRKSASPKGTVISYGRGPEGEEVIIDITETKHINLKVIITFFVCLPVMMALFSAVYGVDSLDVTSENCFSRGKYLVLSSFVCGVLVNWLLQSVVYILIHPAAYRMLKIRYNKRNYTFRLFHKGNLKIRHFRIANMLAHSLCGYIPLIAGFVVGDVSICYFAFLSVLFFSDEISLLWRLRHYSGQSICRYISL